MRFLPSLPTGPLAAALALALLGTEAAALKTFDHAEVTRILNEVRLLSARGEAEAALGIRVDGETAVRTGRRSRAELTFPNDSIVRLGSNSLFNFHESTRVIDLRSGTILVDQPSFRGRTTIRTAGVTAAITGTTVMCEYVPGAPGNMKVFVLEGGLTLSLDALPSGNVRLESGEMTAFRLDTKSPPEVFVFDIQRLMKTSILVNIDPQRLNNYGKIQREISRQGAQKRRGELIEVPKVKGAPQARLTGGTADGGSATGSPGPRDQRIATETTAADGGASRTPRRQEADRRDVSDDGTAPEIRRRNRTQQEPDETESLEAMQRARRNNNTGPDCSLFENFRRPECTTGRAGR